MEDMDKTKEKRKEEKEKNKKDMTDGVYYEKQI